MNDASSSPYATPVLVPEGFAVGAASATISTADLKVGQAMIITFGGRFENALIREVTAQGDRSRLETDHNYYRSLYRYTPRSYFDRCATFIAITNSVSLPLVDWTFRQGGIDRGITEEQFGVVTHRTGGGEWFREIENFAALVLA